MDSDDILSEDKIEKQMKVLLPNPNKVSVCNYIEFSNNEIIEDLIVKPYQKKFIYTTDNTVEFLLNLWGSNGEESFVQTNCWLMSRQLVSDIGGWRIYSSVDDDGEFFTRLLLASNGIVYVEGPLVYYRRTESNSRLSSNSNYNMVKNKLLTIDLKYSYVKKHSNVHFLNVAFAKQYFNFAVYNFPRHTILSKIAFKKYKKFKLKVNPPLLGGRIIELIKNTLGWKVARLIKYYLR